MDEFVSSLMLLLFLVGLWIGSTRTLFRFFHYRRMGWAYPQLIWRDLIVQGGLATTFALISVGRILDAAPMFDASFRHQAWWIALSSIPAVVAVWTYAYYEVFKLDRLNGEHK